MANNLISSDVDNISVANSFSCDPETCNLILKNTAARSLKIITQNIRSIHKNIDGYQAQLARFSFEMDIIILTECWLSDNKPIPVIENYETFATKTRINQNSGIVIYVKNDLRCIAKEPNLVGANFLLLKIHPDIYILAVYRSPSVYCTDGFLNSLDMIIRSNKAKHLIVIGDVNIDIKNNTKDRNSVS